MTSSKKTIYPVKVQVRDGRIHAIQETNEGSEQYILPGFTDAHVHIESSMLPPSEFARMAVVHGTVATVSDPHEIANVLGKEGVEYMIKEGKQVPFYFNFGAPSCVPATPFETAGATLDLEQVAELLDKEEIKYLAEMMNWPGVLNGDDLVMDKIKAAKERGKPIDGHAPGLQGEQANTYIKAGISTDHECFNLEEARHKAAQGMKILIREGSAAKNFEALHPIIAEYPELVMFCCDDKHPDSLEIDHINGHVRRALDKGYDFFDVLRAACLHPHAHYGLEHGLLREGDPADFILVNDLKDWKIQATYLQGIKVAEAGQTLLERKSSPVVNHFNCAQVTVRDFGFKSEETQHVRVIDALDGELITKESSAQLRPDAQGDLVSDTDQDVLKMAVVNRYQKAPISLAYIRHFGLKGGAIAGSVAHDSHNIVAVGVGNEALAKAVNALIETKGGLVVVDGEEADVLPLPIAGLMTPEDGYTVSASYTRLHNKAKQLGSSLSSPFMTLSFMALLVIPDLKLSDKGLFSGQRFEFTDVLIDS